MIRDPGEAKPGQEVKASHIEFLRDLASMLGLGVSGSLEVKTAGVVTPYEVPGMWIKLTSRSSANYAWTEQISTGGGTWADGPQSGTTSADPALEINGNTLTIPGGGYIVRAWRSEGGSMLFQFGVCS